LNSKSLNSLSSNEEVALEELLLAKEAEDKTIRIVTNSEGDKEEEEEDSDEDVDEYCEEE